MMVCTTISQSQIIRTLIIWLPGCLPAGGGGRARETELPLTAALAETSRLGAREVAHGHGFVVAATHGQDRRVACVRGQVKLGRGAFARAASRLALVAAGILGLHL